MDRIDPTIWLIVCVSALAIGRLIMAIKKTPAPKPVPAVDNRYEEESLDRRLKDFLGLMKFGCRLPPEQYRVALNAVRSLRYVARRELHARGPEAMLAMVDEELAEIRRTLKV